MSDRKRWEDVTDDEIVAAVRFACERDRDGIARGTGAVTWALEAPRADQWPGGAPANASLGLGIVPRLTVSTPTLAARLRRLAKDGRVERVPLVRPRGKPAPPGWRVTS